MAFWDFFNFKSKFPSNDFRRKYQVIKRGGLGSGGNGDVRKVMNRATNELVALKSLNDNAKNDQEKRLRFEDEIRTMLAVAPINTGVIPILDYSIEGCWYTMPIADKIEGKCDDTDKTIDAIIQIAETLVKLHELGFAHRDIKPMNILYFNGRFVLCDFGLVDIPDNPHNLTRESQRLGAVRTIAPEMSRDPKHADGKKADVYSLAKTLWILLTGEKKCFEGRYDFMDRSLSLHQFDVLKKHHLVEIDNLLTKSTANDPEERPSMTEFCDALKMWKKIKSDHTLMQLSNWNYIKEYMFHGEAPETSSWSNATEIVNKLNILRLLPLYAHIFFPDRGWMEFSHAELSSESGRIDLYTGIGVLRVQPLRLIFENFKQPFWNYFLLELSEQQIVVGTMKSEFEECVCEDSPGHYVNAEYFDYGVYDYDSGEKLPDGAKVIHRYLKGKFLFIPKFGPYNSIASADDGRHAFCTAEQFKDYVKALQNVFSMQPYIEKEKWKWLYNEMVNNCPYSPKWNENSTIRKKKQNPDYVKENMGNFDFSSLLNKYQSMPIEKASYQFQFHVSSTYSILDGSIFSDKSYFLCKDGHIRSVKADDETIYEVTDRDNAVAIYKELRENLKCYCGDEVDVFSAPFFSVIINKRGKPDHLFTKQEIEVLMRSSDDRQYNTLVINENGVAQMVQDPGLAKFYPVINETWCAGNNYVGKYSKLGDLERTYSYSLGKWLDYLKEGVGQSQQDYLTHHESPEELVDMITKANM